jgi:hypothetical protein
MNVYNSIFGTKKKVEKTTLKTQENFNQKIEVAEKTTTSG